MVYIIYNGHDMATVFKLVIIIITITFKLMALIIPVGGKNMNKRYTSHVMLGVIAMSVLLLSASPIMAGSVTIDTNPSGATATLGGKSLGATPVTIDTTTLSSTYLRLTKTGYDAKNILIYQGLVGTYTYKLKSSSTTTTYSAPAPTPAPTPTPTPTPAPAPAPASGSCGSQLLVKSEPSGAKVYTEFGDNPGVYLATTPFCMPDHPNKDVFVRLKLQGYYDGVIAIRSYYLPPEIPYIVVYLSKA